MAMQGGQLLSTVTVKKHRLVSPLPTAVQVTVVVPTGKKLGEGGLQDTTSSPGLHRFVALMPYVTNAPPLVSWQGTIMSEGQVTVTHGGQLLDTVTVKLHGA